jgi:type VI secretion system protein ImpA
MAEKTAFPVDLAELLQPISARQPAGEWLRYEGTYDAVQEARRAEDESLPKGIWQSKIKRADFIKVEALCLQALRERTKDLQLAVWLTEAWLVRYGLAGFAQGLRLCRELLLQFWETLYPVLDEGDTAYRLAPLELLDRKIALRLKDIPLTKPAEHGEQRPPLDFADWERALHNEKTGQAGGAEELLTATFLAAAAATPPSLYVGLHADLGAVDKAAAALEEAVGERTGERNLVLRGLRSLVGDILALIGQYTPATPAELEAAEGATSDAAADVETSFEDAAASPRSDESSRGAGDKGAAAMERARPGSEGPAGPIKSRSEAYSRLAEAAEYLLRTEPHSPVPYLVKRAVSWGNLNLMQLMSELVTSEADRQAIYTLLGIKAPPQ